MHENGRKDSSSEVDIWDNKKNKKNKIQMRRKDPTKDYILLQLTTGSSFFIRDIIIIIRSDKGFFFVKINGSFSLLIREMDRAEKCTPKKITASPPLDSCCVQRISTN